MLWTAEFGSKESAPRFDINTLSDRFQLPLNTDATVNYEFNTPLVRLTDFLCAGGFDKGKREFVVNLLHEYFSLEFFQRGVIADLWFV